MKVSGVVWADSWQWMSGSVVDASGGKAKIL